METKFQTSFIPKKQFTPIGGLNVQPPHSSGSRTTSLFLTIGGLLFIASIVAAGSMYFWKSYLLTSQVEYKTQLAEREKQFNSDLIEELKAQNTKIDIAKNLINNHVAVSQIFDIIGRLTIEKVRFLSMDLAAGTNPAEGYKLIMKGYGTNLPAIAFQSDVLGKLEQYGLRKVVKNPILSDPSVDSEDHNVSFGLTATIDPASLSYRKTLGENTSGTSTSSGGGTP